MSSWSVSVKLLCHSYTLATIPSPQLKLRVIHAAAWSSSPSGSGADDGGQLQVGLQRCHSLQLLQEGPGGKESISQSFIHIGASCTRMKERITASASSGWPAVTGGFTMKAKQQSPSAPKIGPTKITGAQVDIIHLTHSVYKKIVKMQD